MKTNKELNDPDVATNSLASPQTSPEKQAQCGFSCSFSHSSQLLSSHRKLMNNGLRCAAVPPGTVSHHNTGSNTPSGCPCCFFSTFGHIYFHCVWCCTALHFLFMKAISFCYLTEWNPNRQVFNHFSSCSSHSVPSSRATALHFGGWWGNHAHTHSLHRDGHAAIRGRRAGVERIS